jgi:hypothetical protein
VLEECPIKSSERAPIEAVEPESKALIYGVHSSCFNSGDVVQAAIDRMAFGSIKKATVHLWSADAALESETSTKASFAATIIFTAQWAKHYASVLPTGVLFLLRHGRFGFLFAM